MKRLTALLVITLLPSVLFTFTADSASSPKGSRSHGLLKISDYKFLDGNRIKSTLNSDGVYVDSRLTGSAGMEWPKGSGKTCVYSAGLWLIGKHRPSGKLRTAVMNYDSEFQPGPLLEQFNTSTNDGGLATSRANDPRFRLYKIQKDVPDGDSTRQLDAWTLWPGDLGAPYVDKNSDGIWEPGVDEPKFYGDQQTWCVTNDVDSLRHNAVGTTAPMGLELRSMQYVLNSPSPLENVIFLRWQIINRSDADYDSVFCSTWADVDLGNGNDDMPGCDSTLALGFVFNGSNLDCCSSYTYGSPPPAVGFFFLAGPEVPGLFGDSALVDGRWFHGVRNLGMTAFVAFTSTAGLMPNDPPAGWFTFPRTAYNYQMAVYLDSLLVSPTTGLSMRYWFSGDPVANTGDLGPNFPLGYWNPQDIRICPSSGPFSIARGDTQEITAAFVASLGSDYLNSVTVLKQDAINVRAAFYDSIGVTGIRNSLHERVQSFSLMQNYPNPFNPTTTIAYTVGGVRTHLPAGQAGESGFSLVRLAVYDLLGREIAVLVNERMPAGRYEVKFDGSRLASGVYVYRLTAGSFVQTRKLLLLR